MTTARGQAAIFAIAMTATTAAGHVAGHGSVDGLTWVLPMLGLAFVTRVALGRRVCSLPLCASACATLQLGGHLLLMRVTTEATMTMAGNPGVCGDNLMPGMIGRSTAATLNQLPPATLHPAHAGAGGWAMLGGHLLVALATAWWLHRGELVAEALGAWVTAHVLPPLFDNLPAGTPDRPTAPAVVVRRLRARLLVLDAPGRAPPPVWA